MFAQKIFLAQGRKERRKNLETLEPSSKRCAEFCVRDEFHDPSRDSLVSYSSENGFIVILRNRKFYERSELTMVKNVLRELTPCKLSFVVCEKKVCLEGSRKETKMKLRLRRRSKKLPFGKETRIENGRKLCEKGYSERFTKFRLIHFI